MPDSFQFLLFDLDGTLSNPSQGIYNGFRHALTSMNIRFPEEFEWNRCIGPPLQDSFQRYFFSDKEDIDTAVQHFRKYYAEHGWKENELYEGIPELCRDLKSAGKNLSVVTNKPTVFARQILAHFRIDEYFDEVSGQPLQGQREKSDLIKDLLRAKNADARTAMLIGDTSWDIEAARNAGIASFSVSYGFEDENELRLHAPDFLTGSIDGLRQSLLK